MVQKHEPCWEDFKITCKKTGKRIFPVGIKPALSEKKVFARSVTRATRPSTWRHSTRPFEFFHRLKASRGWRGTITTAAGAEPPPSRPWVLPLCLQLVLILLWAGGIGEGWKRNIPIESMLSCMFNYFILNFMAIYWIKEKICPEF